MTTKINYEAVPQYKQVEAVGLSKAVLGTDVNGSVERNKFTGRKILTLTEGFDSEDADKTVQIAKGDGTRLIQTVKSVDSMEIAIKLGDGFTSRKLVLQKVLACTTKKIVKDGSEAVIAYVKWDDDATNGDVLGKIREFAPKMLAAHPDAFGDWMLVNNDGHRVFVYTYSDVDENGKGVPQD